MLKKLIRIIIPLLTCYSLFAQDYILFENIYLEPINGQTTKLVQGVKKHNAKYHDGVNGPKAYLFFVWTGEYSGQYVWVKGPMKWSELDGAAGEAHTKDWEMNVDKYGRSHNIQYSLRDEDLTYNPNNETVGENVLIRTFDVNNKYGDMAAVRGAIKLIKETLVKMNSDIARRVYTNEFRTFDRRDIFLVYPFQSWEKFEGPNTLPLGTGRAFEEYNGEGSLRKLLLDVWDKHTDGWSDEVRTMVK